MFSHALVLSMHILRVQAANAHTRQMLQGSRGIVVLPVRERIVIDFIICAGSITGTNSSTAQVYHQLQAALSLHITGMMTITTNLTYIIPDPPG